MEVFAGYVLFGESSDPFGCTEELCGVWFDFSGGVGYDANNVGDCVSQASDVRRLYCCCR